MDVQRIDPSIVGDASQAWRRLHGHQIKHDTCASELLSQATRDTVVAKAALTSEQQCKQDRLRWRLLELMCKQVDQKARTGVETYHVKSEKPRKRYKRTRQADENPRYSFEFQLD